MQNQPVETVIIDGVSQPFENRFPSLDDRQIAATAELGPQAVGAPPLEALDVDCVVDHLDLPGRPAEAGAQFAGDVLGDGDVAVDAGCQHPQLQAGGAIGFEGGYELHRRHSGDAGEDGGAEAPFGGERRAHQTRPTSPHGHLLTA